MIDVMIIDDHKVALSLLGGSRNRNLNVFTSDRDMKYFVLPTIKELYDGKTHKNLTVSEKEDVEIHDVRKLESVLFKANLTYLELLYSIEIKSYFKEMDQLINLRDDIVKMNLSAFYSACMGMYNREYNSILNVNSPEQRSIVDVYGYNTKKAMMSIHFLNFILKFEKNDFSDFKSCNWYETKERQLMLDIKTGFYELSWVQEHINKKFTEVKKLESIYKSCPVDFNTLSKIQELLYLLVTSHMREELKEVY